MWRQSARARMIAGSGRRLAARPAVEGLEERLLLYSVTGDHFTYGSRITWSIMPDGTNLGGIPSNLNATLNNKLGSSWASVLSDAFAEWEAVTNVNFVQVPDDGAAFGSGNYQQGSSEYGDIRIGSLAQNANILAFTMLPPSANGGSDAGDILLNSVQAWNVGSNYDLETVLVHEIGHALGMGHSTDVNAVMYPYYGGVEPFPNTDDIAGVRSIWAPRQEDPIEVNYGNTTSSKAADVTGYLSQSTGQLTFNGLDVANPGEAYWFKITTPANASNVLTAQVQSANLSELSPRVQIYNAALQGLVQTTAPSTAYGITISTSISNATPNTVYYIKVLGSNSGATGTGNYALSINTGSSQIPAAPPPNTTVQAQPDKGGGNEEMTVGGGLGSWLKTVALTDKVPDLTWLQYDGLPMLNGQITLLAKQITTSETALKIFEDEMIGLLQAAPIDTVQKLMDPTGTDLVSRSDAESIVSGFFTDLDNSLYGSKSGGHGGPSN